MPKTNAQYQAEHRQRQKERISALEDEIERLRDENADLEARLAKAEEMKCKHPAMALEGSWCHACQSDAD